MKERKTQLLVVSVYLLVCMLALAYSWAKGHYDPIHSEFSGIYMVMLGFPWTLFATIFVNKSGSNGLGLMVLCAIPNAICLWWITKPKKTTRT